MAKTARPNNNYHQNRTLIAALLLLTWCASLSTSLQSDDNPNDAQQQQQQQQQDEQPLSSKIILSYNSNSNNNNNQRWTNHQLADSVIRGSKPSGSVIISGQQQQQQSDFENEINLGGQHKLGGRQQYVCGRTAAINSNSNTSNRKHEHRKQFYDKEADRNNLAGNSNSNSNGQAAAASAPVRTKYRPFEIRTPRIIGGDETSPGEFPWTVSVKLNGQPICGGSLINRNWILTAAHCVVGYNPRNLTVRLGAYRIKDTSEQQTIDSPISLFIVHKQYSMPRPFSNDIALLKMADSIEYSDYVIPICLPTDDQVTTSGSIISELTTIANNNNNNNNNNDHSALPTVSSKPNKLVGANYLDHHHPTTTTAAAASSATGSDKDLDSYDAIVVTTKMSDKQISRCFKQLEQNYLNSIGLGSSAAAVAAIAVSNSPADLISGGGGDGDDEAQPVAAVAPGHLVVGNEQANKQQHYLMPPMPVELIPLKKVTDLLKQQQQQQHQLQTSKLIFADSSSSASLSSSSSSVPSTSEPFLNHLYENNNNNISFPLFSSDFSTSNNNNNYFEQQLNARPQPNQFSASVTNNQHQINAGNRNQWKNKKHSQDHGQQVSEHQRQHDSGNGNYNGLAWSSRSSLSQSNSNSGSNSNSNSNNYGADQYKQKQKQQQQQQQQQQAIKLTSLPISKELLREIQSVGSMQSLNLAGLQQGDFVAMASDLSEGGVGVVMTQPLVESAAAAVERERERVIIGHQSDLNQYKRKIVRDADLLSANNEINSSNSNNNNGGGDNDDDKELDGTRRYSGMSGIVVGWGWVRENSDNTNSNNNNDADQQQVTGGGGGSGSGSGASNQRNFQSVTLQKVRLPILRNSDCEAWFRSQEKKITLLPSQFCAGFNLGGKDACRGDSGGPMIIEDNTDTGRYKLIGIVSAGIGCARPSLPGLYTRVASFLPWIHAQMMHH